MLYPFGVGPDARLLARPGRVVWIAALLAAILPLDRLIEPDIEAGLFDQWALRGLSEEALVLVRIAAHWISFGGPLLLATRSRRAAARRLATRARGNRPSARDAACRHRRHHCARRLRGCAAVLRSVVC
jgi:hypothetical protein